MPETKGTKTVPLNPNRESRFETIRTTAQDKLRETISRPVLMDKMMTVYEKHLEKL